ncbi:MAG: AAA family ATPase [Bacillota bacterium]|nr:AAA family ATPase [Bacillota bacterium]
MVKFIMMVGLPGSGKSSLAKEISIKENAVIHSSDELRLELFGDVNNSDKNNQTFTELDKRIRHDLLKGFNVIYDATNISYKKRKCYLDKLKSIPCYKKCYFLATHHETCLKRNKARNRFIPEEVIINMLKGIFVPQYFEGWDNIEIIFDSGEKYREDELFNDLDGISQDNPHHTLTIGRHCKKAMEYIEENYSDLIIKNAALFHDIGKKLTKDFKNHKGEITEIAHYYNHQNVSAYLSLFYLKELETDDILKITDYIQWHMQVYNMESSKSRNKFIKLKGKEFYDNLLKLNEADMSAK